MSEQQKGLIAAPDELYLKKAINSFGNHRRYIITRWRFLLMMAVLGGAIGLITSLLTKTVYTAESTFVLEEDGKGASGGMGQYSALAAMAGIDVGSSAGLFQSDNIIQLYKSRLMVQQTLLTPATFNGKPQLLIDRFIQFNRLREKWENTALASISFSVPKSQFSILQDSLLSVVVNDINKNYLSVEKPDKKMSLVSVKVKAKDQLFAKAFTETIVANVNTFYIHQKTKKALQNVQLLQHQADSVHRLLGRTIVGAAAAYDANPNPDPANLQQLRAPAQRRQVDVQASTAIYTEVVRNLEIARAALQRETPLIQVIDEPMLPLPKDRLGKLKGIITGGAVALLLGILWLISLRVYKGIMA